MHDIAYRAERVTATAGELWERESKLISAGLDATHVLAWTWLWVESLYGLGNRSFKITAGQLGRALGKTDVAASKSLSALEKCGLIHVEETKRGRGGYTLLEVFDPLEVLERRPRRVDGDPQQQLAIIEDEPPEADQNPSGAIAVVGFCGAQTNEFTDRETPPARTAQADLVATDDDTRTVALVSALRSQLGAERYELWLAGCRYEWGEDALKVFAPNKFVVDFAENRFRRERIQFSEALAGTRITFHVDETLARCPAPRNKTQPEERGGLDLRPQELRVGLVIPSKGLLNQTNNQDERCDLLTAAMTVYEAVGDQTLYRWIALLAALHAADGKLAKEQLESIIDEARDYGDFAKRLKRYCHKHRIPWWTPRVLKVQLEKRGIKWRDRWERSEAGDQPNQTRRNRR